MTVLLFFNITRPKQAGLFMNSWGFFYFSIANKYSEK